MIQQLGNAGQIFGGSDIPGFYGNPTDDLYVMFYQAGGWYPFMRAHSQSVDTPFLYQDREPWMQTSRVREAIRNAINLRYDLILYIYTTFENAARTAEPLVRPMWHEFPDETRFWNVASQFMFGSGLLVAPKVTKPKGVLEHVHMQQVTYALPLNETWYHFYNKTRVAGTPQGQWVTEALPDLEQAVYVRGGQILPILQHDDCMALLPCLKNNVSLEVYPSETVSASGALYIDDGTSFDYKSSTANYTRVTFYMNAGALRAVVDTGGTYSQPFVNRVIFYGWQSSPKLVTNSLGTSLTFIYVDTTQTLYIQLA